MQELEVGSEWLQNTLLFSTTVTSRMQIGLEQFELAPPPPTPSPAGLWCETHRHKTAASWRERGRDIAFPRAQRADLGDDPVLA
jgi:hypothetical protein